MSRDRQPFRANHCTAAAVTRGSGFSRDRQPNRADDSTIAAEAAPTRARASATATTRYRRGQAASKAHSPPRPAIHDAAGTDHRVGPPDSNP